MIFVGTQHYNRKGVVRIVGHTAHSGGLNLLCRRRKTKDETNGDSHLFWQEAHQPAKLIQVLMDDSIYADYWIRDSKGDTFLVNTASTVVP